jgi:hypothetical protein
MPIYQEHCGICVSVHLSRTVGPIRIRDHDAGVGGYHSRNRSVVDLLDTNTPVKSHVEYTPRQKDPMAVSQTPHVLDLQHRNLTSECGIWHPTNLYQ